MKDQFVLLHLSDAHLGNPRYLLDSLGVFEALYKDLEASFNKDNLKPDVIVFSGDLAFGSIPEKPITEQYDLAKQFLTRVSGCFNADYGEIPILLVPGNHDINRGVISEGDKLLRKESFNAEYVDELMQKNEITWKRILERQKEWYDFVTSIPNQPWKIDAELNMVTGIMTHLSRTIGFAGLNSSWASHEQNESSQLWIGKYQYDLAFHSIKDADFKIVVSHHPTDCLNEDEKHLIAQKIETQFQIFLHGHEHTQWFIPVDGHLRCLAGACYNGSNKQDGFSWILIDQDHCNVTLRLREYTDQGAGGWRANCIPGKTDNDGCRRINLKGSNRQAEETAAALPKSPIECYPTDGAFPNNLDDFLRILVDRFYFRWENAGTVQETTKPLIYWPVRLRHPTPIHASQCFVAAGLQKLGCHVSLWTDDLGTTDYSYDVYIGRMKDWYARAGGDESQIQRRRFSEIINDNQHVEPAWQMLQKWLGTMAYFTDRILKISKIWPSIEESAKGDSEAFTHEFSRCRPRRLMTASMVWTCMLVLHKESPSLPIITLGGYDEQELWDAWRTCCGLPNMQVGHLYLSKLTKRKNDTEHAFRMKDDPLAWTSKEDILDYFLKSLTEIDSPQTWSNARAMIPWTINNCVLLPSFIKDKPDSINIGGQVIHKFEDLKHFTPSVVLDDLVGATNKWLF
jgi:predicted MPP superfamily phosphohydrolase